MSEPRLPFQRGEDGLLARDDFTPERIAALRAEVERHGQWTFVSEEERERSRRDTLARHAGGDLWIFGYGSLMWNPALNIAESRVATITGYERSFCLTLILGRASPDAPGLMLAIDTGRSCTGVAHRIEAARVEDETSVLWMREMLSGAYTPVWVRCEDGADGFDAITFVINRAHPRFAPPGTLAEQAAVIARAAGASGANRDYLYRCTQDLRARGVADPYVEALFSAVTAITGEPGDPLPFGGKIP